MADAPESIMECPDTYIDTCKCPTPMVAYVRHDIADARVAQVWKQAIDVVRNSAKKSMAAGLDVATVEIAIARLENAARAAAGKGGE